MGDESLPLGQRLLAAYDSMPRGERRLADLLLEDVGALRYHTAGELAARAGVSKATAARLFRRVGYPGFKAAQREVRDGAAALPSDPDPLSSAIKGAAGLKPSGYLEAEVRHMVRTFELQRSDEIARAVQLLRQADKLWVVGFGDDYALAHFARALLIKLRPDVRMIPIGGFPVPEEFASITERDTVLAFGVGRRTQALRNVVGSSSRAGAKVILVTDGVLSADRAVADLILRTRSTGPTLFGSMTATVSLLTFLCASLAGRIGYSAVERLQTIEAVHQEWGDGLDAAP